MPRSRRDGTPAREPNRRRLSEAFAKTVRSDSTRVVVYWDTLHRVIVPGSACTRSAGAERVGITWATPERSHWLTHAGLPARSWLRSPRAQIRMQIGSRCEAGARSSRWLSVTSRSTLGSATRAGGKRTRSSPGTCCHVGPSSTSGTSGGRTSKPQRRPSQLPSWQIRFSQRPARSSAGRYGRTSSLRTRAPGWRRTTRLVASACSATPKSPRSGLTSARH